MKKSILVVLVLILGLLAYIAFKPQTPAVYPDQIVPTGQTTTIPPSSPTISLGGNSQLVEKPIEDYEVRLSEPLLNTKLYVGDTVQFKISVGKKVIGLNVLGVSLDSDSDKHSSIVKIDSSHYSVSYHVLPSIVFLGQNYINVFGNTNTTDYSLPIPTPEQLGKLALKIPVTLDSHVPVTSIDVTSPTLNVKIGGTYINGKYIPATPPVIINFSDGTEGISGDNSVIQYTVADTTIAQIKLTNYSMSSDLKYPLKVVDVVGLKTGTTTLTINYQNISKSITVNITQ